MAIKVRLSDGDEFVVYSNTADLTKAFRDALDENRLVEVRNGDGRVRVINPHQILYFEELAASEASAGPEAALAQLHLMS